MATASNTECLYKQLFDGRLLTKDVSLMVTDFSEEDEVEESKMLWESQIADLKQVLGSS